MERYPAFSSFVTFSTSYLVVDLNNQTHEMTFLVPVSFPLGLSLDVDALS